MSKWGKLEYSAPAFRIHKTLNTENIFLCPLLSIWSLTHCIYSLSNFWGCCDILYVCRKLSIIVQSMPWQSCWQMGFRLEESINQWGISQEITAASTNKFNYSFSFCSVGTKGLYVALLTDSPEMIVYNATILAKLGSMISYQDTLSCPSYIVPHHFALPNTLYFKETFYLLHSQNKLHGWNWADSKPGARSQEIFLGLPHEDRVQGLMTYVVLCF